MPLNYQGAKYYTTPEKLRETLQQYGVAIIPQVLTVQECLDFITGMWDSLEFITQNFATPLKRTNQGSWPSFYQLMPMHSMLMQHFRIGHAQWFWNLRQHPSILAIQRQFWGTDDLLVSFDGASFHLPPEVTGKGWLRSDDPLEGWLHTDQSYTRNDFECVQSWITALPVRQGDATLTLLEGSHQFHREFASEFHATDTGVGGATLAQKGGLGDWYRLNPTEVKWYLQKGCTPVSIMCPAGSQVFWDSRTIHSGQESMPGRSMSNIRCVAYLCYTPRAWATQANLAKKMSYCNELRMTSHWPHRIKVFGKTPHTYGRPLPPISELPAPVLSTVGRRLAGFEA